MSVLLLGQAWDFYTLLAMLGAFGFAAVVVWLVIDAMSAKSNRAEQRLDDFRDPLARKKREEGGKKKSDAVSRMLEASAPAFAKPLQPKTEKEQSKLKLKLGYAGFRSEAAPQIFLGCKFMMLVVGLVLFGGIALVFAIAQGRLAWVRWRWVSFAGALTYPFYLLHDHIGFAVIHWMYARAGVSAYVVLPVTLIAMLVLAWLVHLFAEKPLARWLKGRLTVGSLNLDPRDLRPQRKVGAR